ncbi:Sir2 family NAD-dependent protein deacetylase [Propionicimonas sp.]|uniref:Sir2 family NAD-dependent protein deacetylase n=1 Tax=Propionicimonas sp. TaxID=1955623 RepID=UPI0039E4FCCC
MPGEVDSRPPAGQAELDAAVAALAGRRFVALTGAGFSTDSGLPDYRGPDAKERHPMTYDQFVGSADHRRHYWARNHLGWHHMRLTEPNEGHYALARLEASGRATGVITQNVDRLHQRAGSRRVVDLHGHYDVVRCLSCEWTCTRADLDTMLSALNPGFLERVTELGDVEVAPDADVVLEETSDFVVADCPVCGGVLKPDIVFFGESVPQATVRAAFDLVDAADALLVAGTSLAVMSGLRFVRHASGLGLPIVMVNRGLTRGDDLATVRLNAGTTEVVSYLERRL